MSENVLRKIMYHVISRGSDPLKIAAVGDISLRETLYGIYELKRKYGLIIYPVLFSEDLGLGKSVIFCRESSISYSTAKKLLGPSLNLFRGDLEERSFIIVSFYYPGFDQQVANLLQYLRDNGVAECEVIRIRRTYKPVWSPDCFDFRKREWVCNKIEKLFNRAALLKKDLRIDNVDVNSIVDIQVRQNFRILRPRLHANHIRHFILGYAFSLRGLSYIVDLFADRPLLQPGLMWYTELDDGKFLSEIHVSETRIDEIIKRVRSLGQDFITSISTPEYAEGFSIPYELFRGGKWDFPKIQVPNKN